VKRRRDPDTVDGQLEGIRHELLELERGDTEMPTVLRSVRRRLKLIAGMVKPKRAVVIGDL
jgi:hypothetical protein